MPAIGTRAPSKSVQTGPKRPIRADTIRIAGALARQLREGVWRPGDRLPAERDLARDHACARGTIRAALARLAAEGLIGRRLGSGTYVLAVEKAEDDAADITSPDQLLEARRMVEPALVRLAVRAATPRDIERLGEALEVLEACGGDIDRFGDGDLAFHQRLAEATGNPLLIEIYGRVNRVRGHLHWREIQRQTLTRARIDEYHRQHRALLDAIARRDGELAEQLVRGHLAEAESDLRRRSSKR